MQQYSSYYYFYSVHSTCVNITYIYTFTLIIIGNHYGSVINSTNNCLYTLVPCPFVVSTSNLLTNSLRFGPNCTSSSAFPEHNRNLNIIMYTTFKRFKTNLFLAYIIYTNVQKESRNWSVNAVRMHVPPCMVYVIDIHVE